EAGKQVKEKGEANDLLSRIAGDPLFHTTEEALRNVLKPELYVGRAPQQTEEFLTSAVRPVLEQNRDDLGMGAEVNV
ncbi:MAG: adenylosuccinate lyase, partial [Bacillota bacterium]|nr:adenylosuccinate lyase [Bacillota bacterium]